MYNLIVELGSRSYPIYIGNNLILNKNAWISHISPNEKIMIVTNETVAKLYLEMLKHQLGVKIQEIILPDGEKYKNIESFEKIITALLEKNFNRKSVIIALGGGVVGDMSGFAAACFQRGIDFIQIPTTLLAQVDSSVGGKTAINHPLGKNMIGAFHQPRCVVIDTNTLLTLSEREFKAGMAEVIKYGLIIDKCFFEWLEINIDKLNNRDEDSLLYAIKKSCYLKSQIVSEDETEDGIRAILNFGHTFGHAIEAWQNYSGILHGEAISIGIHIAATMSMQLGMINKETLDRVRNILKAAGLPISIPRGMSDEDFIKFMKKDKKNYNSGIRLVLLESLGRAFIKDAATIADIKNALCMTRQYAI